MRTGRIIYADDALALSKINDRQLSELFGLLRSVKDWGDLERRLAVAVRRNATASAARDGFSNMSANGGAGRGRSIGDRTGTQAVASAEDRAVRDPLNEHTVAAVRALEAAVVGLQVLQSRLDAIDHMSRDDDLEPEPGCRVMARIGVWEPVHRTGTVDGRLAVPHALGRWAYDFARATGALPSREQARDHAEGRRVRVKA